MHLISLSINYLPFLLAILGAIYSLIQYFRSYSHNKTKAENYIGYLILNNLYF